MKPMSKKNKSKLGDIPLGSGIAQKGKSILQKRKKKRRARLDAIMATIKKAR